MRQAGSAYFDAAVETMSADETAAMQHAKLRRQLEYLNANSPFHAAKLAEAGAEPGDICSLADLARLPFTEKGRAQGEPEARPAARQPRGGPDAGRRARACLLGHDRHALLHRPHRP